MGKVILITGGTAGIGLAMAEAFLARSDSVVVCGRSDDALQRFSSAHPEALAVKADVTDGQARADMLDALDRRFGRLDILVNNAGVFIERNLAEGADPLHDIEQEITINLTVPIRLTGEVLKRWPALDAIVFVTSGFALVSPTRAPTYGAAKAGLHAFANALRGQLASRGTHVLEVLPSKTDTPMNAHDSGKKMPAAAVAAITLGALENRRPMAFAGPAKLLPLLLRIAPNAIRRMVEKT